MDDGKVMMKVPYGLYVLTASYGDKDNGCIINTLMQITSQPNKISICVNKQNYTHDLIAQSKKFNVSLLTESAPFEVFKHFGFQCGKNVNKFEGCTEKKRMTNGVLYIPKYTNSVISGNVIATLDFGTHSMFIAEVSETLYISDEKSLSYSYYFEHIKPKTPPKVEVAKVQEAGSRIWVCKMCGYTYDESKGEPEKGIAPGTKFEDLPENWVCAICKHPKSDFELQ